jgi:hypothetical protein
MTPRPPAAELRLSLSAPDGSVLARTRLCWAASPSAAALVDAVARRARDARRCGLSVRVESASAAVVTVLEAAGICRAGAPIILDADVDANPRSGPDLGRQAEVGEQ